MMTMITCGNVLQDDVDDEEEEEEDDNGLCCVTYDQQVQEAAGRALTAAEAARSGDYDRAMGLIQVTY
jgi:hypothetical protein